MVALLVAAGCTAPGQYTWADDYVAAIAEQGAYVISRGDQLFIRVWNQEGMSTRARVRDDGKISLPFLGDVVAAGYAPEVLGQQLQTRLKDFLVNPVVTVALEEARGNAISIVGEVSRPGVYQIEQEAGVLHALTQAGGLTDFADRTAIYVLRTGADGTPERIRFRWVSLTRAEGKASAFRLQRGDAIVVE